MVKFPRVRASTKKAYEMYHGNALFGTKEIKELFDCGNTTATKIKQLCRVEMQRAGIELSVPSCVDKDILYNLAGMDIDKITESYKALKGEKK